jgi:hypothetical protein
MLIFCTNLENNYNPSGERSNNPTSRELEEKLCKLETEVTEKDEIKMYEETIIEFGKFE